MPKLPLHNDIMPADHPTPILTTSKWTLPSGMPCLHNSARVFHISNLTLQAAHVRSPQVDTTQPDLGALQDWG
jgi:hypothetical protein